MTDLCVNSILLRANRDLRWLALQLQENNVVAEIEGWIERGYKGFDDLWDDEAGLYKCQDQITGKLADAAISAAFLPLFAGKTLLSASMHCPRGFSGGPSQHRSDTWQESGGWGVSFV